MASNDKARPCGQRHATQRRAGTIWKPEIQISSAGTTRPTCPEYARGWAARCVPRRRYWRAAAHASEVALDHARGKAARAAAADAVRDGVGQLDDLDGARPVGQAADEAALFQGGNQPVDAGFGTKVQGVLHFVEGGRNSGFG